MSRQGMPPNGSKLQSVQNSQAFLPYIDVNKNISMPSTQNSNYEQAS